jgi:hypothetical protein
MTHADHLATLIVSLLLGYLAIIAAGALAFTFIW